jgi:hypothetical protein
MNGRRGKGILPGNRRFLYFLETGGQPLAPGGRLWSQLLPSSRRFAPGDPPPAGGAAVTIGDYFEAVRAFLEGEGAAAIGRLIAAGAREVPGPLEFRLHLAKHGAFYHPCRVAVAGRDFVLNVAVSAEGRALLEREVEVLDRLVRMGPPCFVPEVYARGEAPLKSGETARMFLAPWFSGYHEFHLTRRGGRQGLVVWDPERGARLLAPARQAALYRQAAFILTRYYDPATAAGIAAWHHAAGDFVVRLSGGLDVRLVSAREYRPLFRREGPLGLKAALEGLLVFLVNLTLRMRLDRLDGVGELAWAGEAAVAGALEGFRDALAEKPPLPDLPAPLEWLFRRYLRACGREALREIGQAVAAAAFPPGSAEQGLAAARMDEHAARLAAAVARLARGEAGRKE